MTPLVWFALAALLVAVGLMLLRIAAKRAESAQEPRTAAPEGDNATPHPGDLFTPATDPHPDYRPGAQP